MRHKKWVKAEKELDKSREWMGDQDGHEKLAEVLLRATMTYDDEDSEGKVMLEGIGKALGLVHPVAVFGACSEMVQEGVKVIWRHLYEETSFDDDDSKIATCKAVKEATKAVCDIITSTNYWNAKDVNHCLNQTADLLDKQRIEDEAFGKDDLDEGVTFSYNFEEATIEIKEQANESKDN